MTNQEAINYLKQIYPQGGCSHLDEQRMTAIGMAIEALAENEDESAKGLSVSDTLIRQEAICEDALDTFGIEHQMDKCIEECAELINALEKYRLGRALSPDVVTEIADVMITCVQMSIVFGRVAVVHEEARKLKRLEKRIEKAKNRAKSGDRESAE